MINIFFILMVTIWNGSEFKKMYTLKGIVYPPPFIFGLLIKIQEMLKYEYSNTEFE